MFFGLGKRNEVKALNISDDNLFTAAYGGKTSRNEYLTYHTVGACFRCINLRAQSVMDAPYVWNDPEHPVAQFLDTKLPALLFLVEASLSIYGSAYLLKEKNRYGVPNPRWVLSTTINPYYEPNRGLVRFDRVTVFEGTKHYQQIPLEDIVYLWYPNMFSETGHGTSPTRVALGSANVLIGLDVFAERYFRTGAIKTVLLQLGSDDPLQGTPPKEERDRITRWWKNLVGGVHNAHESVVVSSQINPVTIGEGLHELDTRALVENRREDICISFGVPMTLLVPASANYATAQIEYEGFWTSTILPECKLVYDILNTQLLHQYGLSITPDPMRVEALKTTSLMQAEMLTNLVASGIFTLNEAREFIGKEPLKDTAQPLVLTEALINTGAFSVNDIRASYGLDPIDTSVQDRQTQLENELSLLNLAIATGMSLDQAAAYLGITIPEPITVDRTVIETAPKEPPSQVEPETVDPELEALRSLYNDTKELMLVSTVMDTALLHQLQQAGDTSNEDQTPPVDDCSETTTENGSERYP